MQPPLTPTKAPQDLSPAQLELIETAARIAHRVGLPRSTGQVGGLLFVSPGPLSLDAIAETLALSKTSVSTATRQLSAFSMIRQVWLPGDRRDHFEARVDLRDVLRANYQSFLKPRLDQAEKHLESVTARLDVDLNSGLLTPDAHAAARARLESLSDLDRKLKKLLPLAEKLL